MHALISFSHHGNCIAHTERYSLHKTVAVMFLTIVALFLSGCGGGPPPRLYLLESPVQLDSTEPGEAISITALGISRVTLPGYASDARIATLRNDGVVRQLDSERWAEDPEDAITRFLAERLRLRASATVLLEPWPRDYKPEARIEIMLDKLLRRADGGAQISGQIQLLSGDGRSLLQSIVFEERAVGRTSNSTEFFRAVAVIIDEAARVAIEFLQTNRRPS